MWFLRLILILLGIAFIVGVYVYTRRHPPRRDRERPERSEPSLGLRPIEAETPRREKPPVSMPGQTAGQSFATAPASPASEIPADPAETGAKSAGEGKREKTSRAAIFSLTLRLPREGVEASRLLKQLERLGLVLNEQHIYHRVEADGQTVFSVANLFEPGTLDPLPPDVLLQGLNFFFMGVPSAETSGRFERMLGMAYECARAFNGRLEDAQHRPLTAARELELKLQAAGAGNG